MQNYQKAVVDRKGQMNQPNIIMFASPTITPSNNFKTGANNPKDLNNSQIQGRKVDSPQLRIMKDLSDGKTANGGNSQAQGQNRRDEFSSLFNFQQVNELNHTNKEIQKKQFDFNIKQPKGNITIQYDTFDPPRGSSHHQRQSSKSNKNANGGPSKKQKTSNEFQGRRRQQSQSAPKQNYLNQANQQVFQMAHNQAQPLINLHVQNAKISKNAVFTYAKQKTHHEDAKSSTAVRYQTNLQPSGGVTSQNTGQKQRSKSKNRQKSAGHRSSIVGGQVRESLNKSHMKYKQPLVKQNQTQLDNKENQSINYNEFSPSRIHGKKATSKFLDSDSSMSSPNLGTDKRITKKLEKQYFMDKSTLLKNFSPEHQRSQSKSKSGVQHQQQLIAHNNNGLSDREKSKKPSAENTTLLYKSNNSTIIQPPLQGYNTNVMGESTKNFRLKIKRPLTGSSINNKLFIKGVDKIIRENLKKNRTKEEEEISRRQLEDFRQRLKKIELTQRNQQVRKINASKIVYNHQHKNSQLNTKALIQKVIYKKQRSKSCMNNTDSIFAGFQKPRSKERLPKNSNEAHQQVPQQLVPNVQQIAEVKKEKKREKSLVLELKELKKQIDGEIRREIMAGKLEVQPISAANKRTNLSTINAKKDTSQTRKKNQDSNEEVGTADNSNAHSKSRKKSKSKELINKNISQNIKKFMEKKKITEHKMKSLEQTQENYKQQQRKDNLFLLREFGKKHFRQQSYIIPSKQHVIPNANQIQQQQQPANDHKGAKSTLKARFSIDKKINKHDKLIHDFDQNTIFDKDISGINPHLTPGKNANDISQDMLAEYQIVQYIKDQAALRRDKEELTPPPKKPSGKKVQVFRKEGKSKEKVQNVVNKKSNNNMSPNRPSISIDEQQYTAIRADNIHQISDVMPDNGASLIPPQSDIATLEKSQYERHFKPERSGDYRKQDRKSQGSEKLSKSPQMDKMKDLMKKYSFNLLRSQLQKPSAETKLLIKLHSAAITIQQWLRKTLQARGFYDASSQNSGSMYVNSEEDDHQLNQRFLDRSSDKKYSKEVPKKLIATSSPLRVKTKYEEEKQPKQIIDQRKPNNFYSADSSDMEKVIVCSVITSGRPEGEDSLQNTQKYVPLRQKQNVAVPAKTQIQQLSQISSLANSTFNTAIKAQPEPFLQAVESAKDSQLDISINLQRKIQVPSLDFDKLSHDKEHKAKHIAGYQEEVKGQDGHHMINSSIFEHTKFQDLLQKSQNGGKVNLDNFHEMMKIREKEIQTKKHQEEERLNHLEKSKQITPRTLNRNRKDIEGWVELQKDEVRRIKKMLEDQNEKTAQIIEDTNNPISSNRLLDELKRQGYMGQGTSIPRNPDEQAIIKEYQLSHRALSSRREPTNSIIEQINQKPSAPVQEVPQVLDDKKNIDFFSILQKEREEAEKQEKINKEKQREEERRLKEKKDLEERKRLEEQKRADEKLRQQKEEEERKRKEKEREKALLEERKKQEEEQLKRQKERELKIKQDQEEKAKKEQERLAAEKAKREAEEEKERIRKEKEEREAQEKREKEAKLQELERERERRRAEQKKLDDIYKQKMALAEKKHNSRAVKDEPDLTSFQPNQPDQKLNLQQNQAQQILSRVSNNEPRINSDSEEYDAFQSNTFKQGKGKEILDSQEDSKQSESLHINIPSGENRNKDEMKQLNRTTSSQKIVRLENDYKEESQLFQDNYDEESKGSAMDLHNLNTRSIDETDLQASRELSVKIKDPSFFTRGLDDSNADEIISKVKISPKQEERKEGNIQKVILNTSKIYMEDKGEEVKTVEDSTEEIVGSLNTENVSVKSQARRIQTQIQSEQQEFVEQLTGQPVSPASGDEVIRNEIHKGSQSLVSTLSDETQIVDAIHEANREQENQMQADLITEEVYKQLMNELKLELDLLLLTVPKRQEEQQPQIPHDPPVFNESGRFLIFERRGIKTDLFAIERYVEEVLDEVLKERNKFTAQIQTPLSRNAREVLNQLQNSEIGSYEHFEINYPPVLPLELYLKLERKRKEDREQNQQRSENPGQDRNLLAECEHIHNKVLFDCINDSLFQFKPYGKDGVPLTWSRQNRKLRPMEEFTVEEMFEIVKHDLFRWAIMQAGTLPRKEFVFGGVFDDELFAEIREKKLATLLAREMIETEPKWLNYEFEEAQVKIDIGDMILEQLVTETIAILRQNQANLQ